MLLDDQPILRHLDFVFCILYLELKVVLLINLIYSGTILPKYFPPQWPSVLWAVVHISILLLEVVINPNKH